MKHILRILVVFAGFWCSLAFYSSALAEPDSVQVWRQLTTGVSEPFAHVFVKNADTVYASTQSMLLRTRDGGAHWEQLITDAITRGCIWFMDDTTGIFAPTTDTIYKTTDGGEHWRSIRVLNDQHVILQMQFVGRDTGWIRYNNFLAHTTDGGETWHEENTYCSCFSFATSKIGYSIYPSGDSIDRTMDGGTNWRRSSTENVGAIVLQTIDPDTLISAGYSYAIAKSVDSGIQWEYQNANVGIQYFSGLAFADHRTGWFTTREGSIGTTSDAGETWVPQVNPTHAGLFDIGSASASIAYAVGDSGVILKTTNAGNSWVNVGPGWTPLLKIARIYPQPANESVTVEYSLPESDRVTVTISSASGTVISVPIRNIPQQAGPQLLRLDTSQLPQGTYYLSIRGANVTITGKLEVLRTGI